MIIHTRVASRILGKGGTSQSHSKQLQWGPTSSLGGKMQEIHVASDHPFFGGTSSHNFTEMGAVTIPHPRLYTCHTMAALYCVPKLTHVRQVKVTSRILNQYILNLQLKFVSQLVTLVNKTDVVWIKVTELN